MTQHEMNEQEWSNPDNWSDFAFGLYFSKRDSRVWVPKRERELGWTVNLARPAGAAWLVSLLLAPSAVLLFVLILLSAGRN